MSHSTAGKLRSMELKVVEVYIFLFQQYILKKIYIFKFNMKIQFEHYHCHIHHLIDYEYIALGPILSVPLLEHFKYQLMKTDYSLKALMNNVKICIVLIPGRVKIASAWFCSSRQCSSWRGQPWLSISDDK